MIGWSRTNSVAARRAAHSSAIALSCVPSGHQLGCRPCSSIVYSRLICGDGGSAASMVCCSSFRKRLSSVVLDFDHNGPKRRRRRIGYAGLADGKGQQPAPAHVTGGCFDFQRVQIPCAAYRQMRLECRGSVSPRESSDQAPQHLLLISGRLQPNRSGHPAPRQTPSLRTDAISCIATGSMPIRRAL